MRYTATAIIERPYFSLFTTADSYTELCARMYAESERVRYYTQGVNGGINPDEDKPYTKDLIWPEIKWKITKKELLK